MINEKDDKIYISRIDIFEQEIGTVDGNQRLVAKKDTRQMWESTTKTGKFGVVDTVGNRYTVILRMGANAEIAKETLETGVVPPKSASVPKIQMREVLSDRENWQEKASLSGLGREETAKKILFTYLRNDSNYELSESPWHLSGIYEGRWGIRPDFSIESTVTRKIAFFETKRQGPGGNAHERVCKYFAPGIQKCIADIAGFNFPFFFIFMNGLTYDPKKCVEICAWFDADGFRDRYLMWGDRSIESIINWFDRTVKRYLE